MNFQTVKVSKVLLLGTLSPPQELLEEGLHKNKEENQKKRTRGLTQEKVGLFRLRWGGSPAAAWRAASPDRRSQGSETDFLKGLQLIVRTIWKEFEVELVMSTEKTKQIENIVQHEYRCNQTIAVLRWCGGWGVCVFEEWVVVVWKSSISFSVMGSR